MVMLSKNADMGQAAGRSALPDELLPGPLRQTVGEVQNLKIASLQFFFYEARPAGSASRTGHETSEGSYLQTYLPQYG